MQMHEAALGLKRIAQSSDGIASLTVHDGIERKLQAQKTELFEYCKHKNIDGYNIWAMSHKESLRITDKFLKFQMVAIWKNRHFLEKAEKQLSDFLDSKKPADELKNPYAESGDEDEEISDEENASEEGQKSDDDSDDQNDYDSTH
jgi:hypothetical protein